MARDRKPPGKIDRLLDELMEDGVDAEDLFGEDGLLKRMKKRMAERILEAELTDHLGYEKHAPDGRNRGNSRNGKTTKTLKDDKGDLPVEIPRDREGSFDPKLIRKYQTRWPDFDDKIISMYARGMSTRDIQGHIEDLYGVAISPELVSRITDTVTDEVLAWQSRPLDEIYPILFLDALFVKIRDSGSIRNKAVYLALGVNLRGDKELLGLWIEQNEGAKFWLHVLTELKNRGVADIFIACCDGLSGFPQAIETVYPRTQVQLCIVHMVRNSLTYVSWKDRKQVAKDLRAILPWSRPNRFAEHAISHDQPAVEPRSSPSHRRSGRSSIPQCHRIHEQDHQDQRRPVRKLLYLSICPEGGPGPLSTGRPPNQFIIMYEDRVPITTVTQNP